MANEVLQSKQGHETPDNHATPVSPTGSDPEPANKTPPPLSDPSGAATQPAPKGDPSHPAITTKNGFYFFRDEYQLPKEPAVEDAEALYLAEVEKAFENRWPLHPNLIARRSDAQRVKHAYDLDFRENEIKRIRDILPVDKEVFGFIDALVDVVMLKNLEIYVAKRFAAYAHIVRNTRVWFAGLFLASLGVFSFVPWFLSVPLIQFLEFAPILAIAIATPLTIFANAKLTWPNLSDRELQAPKDKYEEAVRDAANLAANKLATKGRDVESLMNALKNKLDTMNSPDASRVEHAPKLVRILLWSPERMGLIENYYRAKMDQFMVNSARVSIDGTVNTNGIIFNRLIFLSVLTGFFILGVVVAALMNLGGAAGAMHAAAVSGTAPPAAAAVNLHAMWMALTGFALFVAAVAAIAYCSKYLAHRCHSFEPEDVARQTSALQWNGIRAAILAVVLGLAPMIVILIVPTWFFPAVMISFSLLLLTGIWFGIAAFFAHRIFRKRQHEYSSNVLEAVRKKMEASQWTRYSDLRIDQRLSEVFNAIFEAWRRADSKGVFTTPQ